ncbi:MAG: M28 family peptidase [Treponema sp.]|nr:M28 family peptidase [Treponema sp.]
MSGIPARFSEYITSDCDRCAFIQAYLHEQGVASVVLPIAGKRHVYVKFPNSHYNTQFKIKTVVAHYDRVEGTPGANDNSAANFSLMDWAIRLQRRNAPHNIRLLFSDGEELGKGGVAQQGAFSLAALFKRLGIINDDIYVFDCMGRGTIPVLGKTEISLNAPYAFRKKIALLEERASKLLARSGASRWLTLPFAYSDNAGFIASGIPAVVITMLPEDEASRYYGALLREKALESFVMNHSAAYDFSIASLTGNAAERITRLRALLPQTWRLLHTKDDDEASLTPESFALFSNILDVLASEKSSV